MLALGIEGSANKVGVGLIELNKLGDEYTIANVRKTYVSPTSEGFLPRNVAWHHQAHIVALICTALEDSGVSWRNVDVICFTKGPGLGAALRSCAVASRMLALLWNKPIVGVNHCVGHIEMGRVVTHAYDPVILYVSGGNTQVSFAAFSEPIDDANHDSDAQRSINPFKGISNVIGQR